MCEWCVKCATPITQTHSLAYMTESPPHPRPNCRPLDRPTRADWCSGPKLRASHVVACCRRWWTLKCWKCWMTRIDDKQNPATTGKSTIYTNAKLSGDFHIKATLLLDVSEHGAHLQQSRLIETSVCHAVTVSHQSIHFRCTSSAINNNKNNCSSSNSNTHANTKWSTESATCGTHIFYCNSSVWR